MAEHEHERDVWMHVPWYFCGSFIPCFLSAILLSFFFGSEGVLAGFVLGSIFFGVFSTFPFPKGILLTTGIGLGGILGVYIFRAGELLLR